MESPEQQLKSIRYTLPAKVWNIWKAQSKHTYLAFWFAGNGMATTKNKYCDFKKHKRMYRNVLFFNTSPRILHNYQDIDHSFLKL